MANNSTTKAQLEQELAKQKAEMQALLKELESLKNAPKEEKTAKESTKKNKRDVKFVNMTVGGFTIQGTRTYRLEKQFDSRSFGESEAKVIINNMPNAIANGMLYVIADDEFMEDAELYYDGIISADNMKTLLDNNSDTVISAYESACDEQKRIIITMVENKVLNGERIDANILVALGKLCNKDLMNIEPME